MKEQDLISRMVAGDVSAREAFYDAYNKLIWHVLNGIGLQEQDTEELFQEVFVRLFKEDCACLRQWRGENFAAYLARIVRNLTLDYLRAKQRLHKDTVPWPIVASEQEDAGYVEIPDSQPSPEALTLTRDLQRMVRKALVEITPRDHDLLIRFHVHGQTYDEIAAATGMTSSNIGVSLKRARARLAALLNAQYPEIFNECTTR